MASHSAKTQSCWRLLQIMACLIAFQQFVTLPLVRADYSSLSSDNPTYNDFVAGPLPEQDPPGEKLLQADINALLWLDLNFAAWSERARQIQSSTSRSGCIGNLSVALNVGTAYAAGMSGANTLLSLIPTGGVMTGVPARITWRLYYLCPMAGVLAILLSLNSSIVQQASQGEPEESPELHEDNRKTKAEIFADSIISRLRHPINANIGLKVTIGIILQFCAIIVVLIACWILESGAIVVWWCENNIWMIVWYLAVAFSSILQGIVGTPYSRTYTLRIWRTPPLLIDPESPWVIQPSPTAAHQHGLITSENLTAESVTEGEPTGGDPSSSRRRKTIDKPTQEPTLEPVLAPGAILDFLTKGISNTNMGRFRIDPSTPWLVSNETVYVIISIRGVSAIHASVRLVSKAVAVSVYIFGTILFASATLITIPVAILTAALILFPGIFGGVIAVWIVDTIMTRSPILHFEVAHQMEAGQYLEALLRKSEIAVEVRGHIFVGGRCLKRLRRHRWSLVFGILIPPYDLTQIATSRGNS